MIAIKKPRIVIVGRPNVGKSTLFNRLISKKRALVHNLPGVTRDRHEHEAIWWYQRKSYKLTLIDTGGLGGELFAHEIEMQVQAALENADALIIVFDGQTGVTPRDQELVVKFKQSGIMKRIPAFAIVNKVDQEMHEGMAADFYSMGLENVLTLSAEHNRGIDDLKEAILNALPGAYGEPLAEDLSEDQEVQMLEETDVEAGEFTDEGEDADLGDDAEELEEALPEKEEIKKIPLIAILGRPNAGKSTLTNAILGEERMITSPVAGTTIDAIDSLATLSGKPFIIIDTAGIRRKSKTEQGVEVLSIVQAKKALERADVTLLLLDGETGITEQDEKIGGMIQDAGCSVILAVNKWDTQKKTPDFTREIAAIQLRKMMGYLKYAPIIFLSAKQGKGFEDLGDLIEEILHQRKFKITTKEFTEWVRKEATIHNPMNAKFFMCHQTGRNPPTFVCHVNDQKKIHFSLQRHLINALREKWGFMGTPIKLLFVEGKNKRTKPGGAKAPTK